MAQKKKQLVAAGKLDKFGRPNPDTPQASLKPSTWQPTLRVLLALRGGSMRQQVGVFLSQEYLRSLGESAGSQDAGDGQPPRETATTVGDEAVKVCSLFTPPNPTQCVII